MEVILDFAQICARLHQAFWNIGFIDRIVKLKSLLGEEMLT